MREKCEKKRIQVLLIRKGNKLFGNFKTWNLMWDFMASVMSRKHYVNVMNCLITIARVHEFSFALHVLCSFTYCSYIAHEYESIVIENFIDSFAENGAAD